MIRCVGWVGRRSTGPVLTLHLRMGGHIALALTLRTSPVTVTRASYQRGSTGQSGLTAQTPVAGGRESGEQPIRGQ